MKVNSNRDISFKSFYTNKAVKKGLELAADNGALFSASAIVAFSAIRPVSIWLTPQAEKEDKQLAMAKSIVSSSIGFLLMLGLSKPIASGIKKIDKNPEKYLKKESIEKYKSEKSDIYDSKSYTLATQCFKLGLGALTAIPKAIIVAAGIPVFEKFVFKQKSENEYISQKSTDRNINFRGKNNDIIPKTIGKILDKPKMQKFSDKYKDTNFPMHIIAGVDTVSTAAFCYQANKNKDIPPNRKRTLINNSVIGTVLSIICGYTIDKILDKPTQKLIKKYEKINKKDPNLTKQIQGIKIAKPILILGSIYYMLIPLISTFLADKTGTKSNIKYIG